MNAPFNLHCAFIFPRRRSTKIGNVKTGRPESFGSPEHIGGKKTHDRDRDAHFGMHASGRQ
jgi:hypothetical protein